MLFNTYGIGRHCPKYSRSSVRLRVIANHPVLDVRKVMLKLEKERKENETKKISENKQKLEREEADRLESQTKIRGA